MKRKTSIVSMAIIMATALITQTGHNYLYSKTINQDVIPIIVDPSPNNPGGEPRGPVFNPFTAYRMNTQVVLESSTSCGLVAVELTSTAGDYYTTVFDTEDSSILIPISGLTGDYDILLTTQEGLCFLGNFGL